MTGKELADFAESKLGVPYVYGMKGGVMTLEKYRELKKLYGSLVWESDINKVGKVCCDCSGLISWATGIMLGSWQLYEKAVKREPINTVNDAPIGALVWKKGHVGVYVGKGEYIAEDGSAYGCRRGVIKNMGFTHWLLMDYIDYEGGNEMVEDIKVIIDGKEINAKRILKDGSNYIKIRDIAEKMGYGISSRGNIPLLTRKA
ncbi:C40 family peptidase [Anaerotignum faecicola]|nr:C40 family peptidase [Anaerotignum faecicola]